MKNLWIYFDYSSGYKPKQSLCLWCRGKQPKCLQHSNTIASCYSSVVGFYSWADNLTGFSLIMPYTMIRPMPQNMKTSRLYTYDANAKQLIAIP